jgi:hypothetical protein
MRAKLYTSNAERQRAYRDRKRKAASTPLATTVADIVRQEWERYLAQHPETRNS